MKSGYDQPGKRNIRILLVMLVFWSVMAVPVNSMCTGTPMHFNIADNENPKVFALVPAENTTFNVSSQIEIGVNATDNAWIATALANITYPDGTRNQILLSNAGGDKYNNSFNIPPIGGRYNITFIVTDSNGNTNSTETTYFISVKKPKTEAEEEGKGDSHSREWLEQQNVSEPEVECSSDSDCSPSEYCSAGECMRIICACGYIENHRCISYECCSDDDCSAHERCEDNGCIAIEYKIVLEGPFITGQEAIFTAYKDGVPLPYADVLMESPSGGKTDIKTGIKGMFTFVPEEKGEHKASLLSEDGKILAFSQMSARPLGIVEEPAITRECCILGFCSLMGHTNFFGICWYWCFLLLLLPLAYFIYRCIRKERKSRKRKGRKEEILDVLKDFK